MQSGPFSSSQALMILNALPGIGPMKIQKLAKHFFGNIGLAFSQNGVISMRNVLPCQDIKTISNYKKFFDLPSEEKKLESICGKFVTMADDEYPGLLKNIADAPVGVYVLGDLPENSKNIAIVGTRSATLYGMETARNLAMELSNRGFCIVSGMARGIDTAAHDGAIAANGKTISVVGNGVDVIYPYENGNLRRRIVKNGAVISEFPLGRRPDKQTFPIRNRIIAGMCHAVIIVESDKLGGGMITAKFANDYGRHVFAVPGRIDCKSSAGCLSLIKNGASMLTCIDDIFDELPYLNNDAQQRMFDFDEQKQQSKDTQQPKSIPSASELKNISCPIERRVYEILEEEKSASIDSIVDMSGIQTHQIMNALQMLEIRGMVARRYDGLYELKR